MTIETRLSRIEQGLLLALAGLEATKTNIADDQDIVEALAPHLEELQGHAWWIRRALTDTELERDAPTDSETEDRDRRRELRDLQKLAIVTKAADDVEALNTARRTVAKADAADPAKRRKR